LRLPRPNFPHSGSRRSPAFILLETQFWLSLAIIAFFLIMVFLLWRREAGGRGPIAPIISEDFIAAIWEDTQQWMWIERGGERIGAYKLAMRAEDEDEGDGYVVFSQTRMRFNLLNLPVPVELDMGVEMSHKFELETFRARADLAEQRIDVEAFVEDQTMYFGIRGAEPVIEGGAMAVKTPLDGPVILSEAFRPLLTQNKKLRVGRKWTTRASDPLHGRLDMVVTVEVEALELLQLDGENLEAFRVVESSGDRSTTSWYDAEGKLLKMELEGGIVMIRAPRDQVNALYPALGREPDFEPIDFDRLRREAEEAGAAGAINPLPWLPIF
jgi:hypothetical protein